MHYYGGEHYPDNIILVNPDDMPDGADRGYLTALYDFDNTWLTANDIETMQTKLPKGQELTLLNPDTNAICPITSNGIEIHAIHRKGFEHLWRKRRVPTPMEPEQQSLLVHEQDYLDESESAT